MNSFNKRFRCSSFSLPLFEWTIVPACCFRKRWAPSQQRNGTTGENNRISVSHAETKQNPLPGEDRSQSKKLRSNSWAESRDKKAPASSRRGNICLDIPSNRTYRFPDKCAPRARRQRIQAVVRNYTTDEGRPLGTGLQGQVPNHLRRRERRRKRPEKNRSGVSARHRFAVVV